MLPPQWSSQFLRWFCKTEYLEDIQGDLDEEYQLIAVKKTNAKAKRWYNWQILKLFRPSMMKRFNVQNSIEKESSMYKNYLKIGFRNLMKYKSGTAINIIGLSTGLACFILIGLYVKDELSYDRHFDNAENIYRVTVKNYDIDGDMNRHWAFASAGHASRLKEDYSAITHSTRFFAWAFPDIQYGDQKFPSEQVVFADDDAFDIFNFNFLIGNPKTCFNEISSLVLTESSAIKIFGNDWRNQDLLSKSVTLSRDGDSGSFSITGVMQDMPEQQHFHFEYLAPIRFVEMIMGESVVSNVGGNYNWMTYIKVSDGSDIAQLTAAANDGFWDKYIGKFASGMDARNFYDFEFQPLLDIHLNSNLEGEFEVNGSKQQVIIFSIIGVLLLLVACVNYMNLATSHYSRRMKEVGVRKVVGAFKTSLIKQFLTESILVAVISLPAAIMLVYWALPYMNTFMEKQLEFAPFTNMDLSVTILALLAFVGIAAGLYPAMFLSRINLINALKGEQTMRTSRWNFRNWLVTFQYVVTIGLIFTILVIESQLKFIRNTNPGYNREQLIGIGLSRNINNLDVLKNEFLSHPNVNKGTYASRIPTGRLMDNWGSSFFKGDSLVQTSFRLPSVTVDEDYLKTFDIPLIAGKDFDKSQDAQTDSVGYYIINRKAAEAFGFNNPNDIIGERLSYGPYDGENQGMGKIQGVTEDFNFESVHSEIKPMVMIKSSHNLRRLVLHIGPTDMNETLAFLEETWTKFDTENPFDYRFVDDIFNEQYRQEERLSTMINVFTIIAILIGCLGLIGMVGFIVETKLKEIGVRKVLGASTKSILVLISNQFVVLMVIAFAIALPISFWLMSGWLENFVYRTSIGIVLVILPLVITAVLTFLAISYQCIKATLVNPVECLKDE